MFRRGRPATVCDAEYSGIGYFNGTEPLEVRIISSAPPLPMVLMRWLYPVDCHPRDAHFPAAVALVSGLFGGGCLLIEIRGMVLVI